MPGISFLLSGRFRGRYILYVRPTRGVLHPHEQSITVMSAPRLVVALDVPAAARAVSLVDALAPLGVTFKIGYEAFYGYGDEIRAALARAQAGYALDLKLHDIPRTVEAAVRAVVRPGVRILTVHATGGAGENATRLAALARDARCSGVVCSVGEVADMKAFFGSEFKTFCPGIRPA